MASTLKVTNISTPDGAGNITFDRPIVADGSGLTSLPSDITKQSGAPTISNPATPTVGDLILATSTQQLYVCKTVSSGANVWENIGDGSGGVAPSISATGGTIVTYTYDSVDYKVHKITSTGSTNFVVASVPAGKTIDVLVIAGGGGGGAGQSAFSNGGGGGAGGLRWFTGQTPTASTYAAVIGAGGTAATDAIGGSGSTSSFIGTGISISGSGGAGGGRSGSTALAGGSGSGATGSSASAFTGGAGNTGSYTPVEGYAGGNTDGQSGSGGGGGSGGLGTNALISTATGMGHGGVGEDNFLNQSSAAFTVAATKALLDAVSLGEVSGSSRHIAAGGGGGWAINTSASLGGTGGGGNGGINGNTTVPTTGDVNTGSGGGGGYHTGGYTGAVGGSGIVLIRYLA